MKKIDPAEHSDQEDLRRRFVRWLPRIQRTINLVAVRKKLNQNELDAFAAFVYYKLVERGYSVVEQFRGRSKPETYLQRVLERLYVDYRRAQWGKWRPSAAARRLGQTAVQLEQILYRDGCPLHEAIEIMRHQDAQRRPSALHSLVAKLPQRPRRRFEGDSALGRMPADSGPDPLEELDRERRMRSRQRIGAVLAAALQELPQSDRKLIVQFYLKRLSMSQIARQLGCEIRPLYRRKDRILRKLRLKLQKAAFNWNEIEELLGRASGEISISSANF